MGKQVDWIAIEGAYRSGEKSLRDIAAEYGGSESTIRHRAKKNGWVRDPEKTKRQMVRAALSGDVAHVAAQSAMRNIETEASVDVEDMNLGLAVARACLRRLAIIVEQSEDAKEIKVIAESNKIAVETIRRIRGLDDAPEGVVHVSWAGGL